MVNDSSPNTDCHRCDATDDLVRTRQSRYLAVQTSIGRVSAIAAVTVRALLRTAPTTDILTRPSLTAYLP